MSSRARLTEIAREVLDLTGAADIFEVLDGNVGNMQALEQRLQEVMMARPQFQTIELAMYLRSTAARRNHLPTWQPLLNAAIEQGIMRGDNVNDIFLGLAPRRPDPHRNTGHPK